MSSDTHDSDNVADATEEIPISPVHGKPSLSSVVPVVDGGDDASSTTSEGSIDEELYRLHQDPVYPTEFPDTWSGWFQRYAYGMLKVVDKVGGAFAWATGIDQSRYQFVVDEKVRLLEKKKLSLQRQLDELEEKRKTADVELQRMEEAT